MAHKGGIFAFHQKYAKILIEHSGNKAYISGLVDKTSSRFRIL